MSEHDELGRLPIAVSETGKPHREPLLERARELLAERNALLAQNEKLREALRDVLRDSSPLDAMDSYGAIVVERDAWERARAALAQPEGGGA